jgi:hypothetical protein
MYKSRALALILITFVCCSALLIETANVKAAGAFTNYYVGFMQSDYKVAMQNNLIILAKDASNDTVTSYNGPITMTCSDPRAILPTSPQLTLTNGGGSYTVYFGTEGQQTVTVTDVANTAITTTVTVTVAPIHFGLSVTPTTITAGGSVNVTVTALDASNNVLSTIGASGYGASIDFSSTDSQAQFPAAGSPSTLVNGVGVFNITLQTPGSQTITIINKGFTLVNATTSPITVNSVPTATPDTTPTSTPTLAPTPTASTAPSPTSSSTETPVTGGISMLTGIIIAIVIVAVVVVAVVVAVLRRKKKSKIILPPPPPPPPS